MDNMWAFRQASVIFFFANTFRLPEARYDTARKIKENQDSFCSKALKGKWKGLGDFPEDLQWEALVDVLRGRVKVIDRRILRL
jgi:hypothetical protein